MLHMFTSHLMLAIYDWPMFLKWYHFLDFFQQVKPYMTAMYNRLDLIIKSFTMLFCVVS